MSGDLGTSTLGDGDIEPARPTARTAAPFVVVATVGLVTAFLPPYDSTHGQPWLLVAAFGVVLAFLAVSIRRSFRSWVDPVPAFLFFPALALGRDLTGGSVSGLAPLVAIPVLWLALTGTRRQVLASGVCTAALFVLPLVLSDSPAYAASDWRRGLLWSAVALLIAPVVQQVVARLALESHRARAAGAEMDGIMRGARLTSLIATDTRGVVRSFSVGAEELLGHDATDVVGAVGLTAFHDAEEVAGVAAELGVEPGFAVFAELARRAAPSLVWTYRRADGDHRYVRLAMTELHGPGGTLTGYLGVAIDATAAVESEDARSTAEARWRILLDHLPETTVLMLDEQITIRAVAGSGAMRDRLAGAEGRPLAVASNPANMAVLRPAVQAALRGEEVTVELSATSSGAEHEIVVTPLPEEPDGARVLLLARDVSVERARERALVEAKERAERLFADAPHGVAVLAADGVVVRINDALGAVLGRTPAAVEGRRLGDFSPPGDERVREHLAQVHAQRGAMVETDWTVLAADGSAVHVLLSSRVLAGGEESSDLVLVNVVDVSERHRYERRLVHLADHDVLTGLANRRRFDRELARHLEHCHRYGATGALLLLDLDHFKDVNDTLGHGAGDQLIISTAALLQSGVRGTDVVARLGGDEFAILLTEGDRDTAELVARSVVQRVREHTATLDGTRRRVTASVGAVTIETALGHSVDVLALADMTMYDAKDAGRDCFVVLDDDGFDQPRSGARLQWKGRIEEALENDLFALHLQPIQDVRTGAVRSAEVLLRLADTDELVPPSRFLYIAERAGLAPALDSWVIERSVAMLARLREIDPGFELEVNVSGHSIGSPAIEETIVAALDRHGVDPTALILEITETAAVADVEVARQFAERLSALGCKFALDDFGAGFGSFYYLKHLLFDYVKIDGEFVATCHRSGVDRTILRSIVGIARDLGKRTVAEYVSEPAILDVVRAEGVDLAQGYLVGRPVPYDEFVAAFLPAALAGPGQAR